MVWRIAKIPVLLSLFLSTVSGLNSNNFRGTQINLATVHDAVQMVPAVVVDVEMLKRVPGRLEFQVRVSNTGEKSVLIITDPLRLDGSKGAYLSLNEKNSSQLELAFAIYPPPVYTRLAPKTSVTLTKLGAGQIYQTKVVLDTPLTETKPPWGETPHVQMINLAKIEQIIANVGVLPDDPGVHEAVAHERSPDGFEIVKSGPFKGRLLFELQRLVSSMILKL
jgi:hypothetical protein